MNSCAFVVPPNSPLNRVLAGKRPRVLVTAFIVIMVHVILFLAVLIQGCKRTSQAELGDPHIDAKQGVGLAPANSPAKPTESSRVVAPTAAAPPIIPTARPLEPAAPAAGTFKVTPLASSNPKGASDLSQGEGHRQSPTSSPGTGTDVSRPESSQIYVVVRGDTLTKIARAHGTTVKAIQAANNLKSDRIVVGQKLKLLRVQSGHETNALGRVHN